MGLGRLDEAVGGGDAADVTDRCPMHSQPALERKYWPRSLRRAGVESLFLCGCAIRRTLERGACKALASTYLQRMLEPNPLIDMAIEAAIGIKKHNWPFKLRTKMP